MDFKDVLDCIGRDFPSEWGQLFKVLSNRQVSRHAQHAAERIALRWGNRSAAGWLALPAVLLGGAHQRELRGFCAHGYCAALQHILAPHAGEVASCASWSGAWWPWQFVGESRWHRVFRPLDAFDKLRHQRRLQSPAQFIVPRHGAALKQKQPHVAQVCPDQGLQANSRCWYLSGDSLTCASTCATHGLRFAWLVAGEENPVIPKLLGHHPQTRQFPWGRLECYVPSEDRYHTAKEAPDATTNDFGLPGHWSFPSCRLACPCEAPLVEHVEQISTDRYLKDYRAQLEVALHATLTPLSTSGGGTELLSCADSEITFAAFGVHFTTLLEPISAMRQVLPVALRVTAFFWGSSHPPPELIIKEVCPAEGGLPEGGFRCLVSTSPAADFWQAVVDRPNLHEALTDLAALFQSDLHIKRANCLVCGGGHAPTLCMLIRMVTGAPLYFTLQAPLTFRMPKDPDQRSLLVSFFREMVRPTVPSAASGRSVVSTSLIFLQRQYWVQTGCLLPVVRNHNLYAVPLSGGTLQGAATRKEVIFWQNHIALKPDCSITVWRFLKQHVLDDFPFNLVFKNVRKLPTARTGRKVYALGDEDSAILSYTAIVNRFAAAVLFPHDVGMISFDDLYALNVPMFIPENDLVVRMAFAHLSSTKNYPWYLLREEHADLRMVRADVEAGLPWDPGWGGRGAVNRTGRDVYLGHGLLDTGKLAGAVATANFALFPHIRRFSSLAGLLGQLASLQVDDLIRTSLEMRRSALEAWAVTAEFYRRAAWHLLSPICGPQ